MSDMKNHWNGYMNAIGGTPKPISTNSQEFPNSSSKIGVSGFLDLKPAKPEIQARYDAMNPTWGGIDATNKAVFVHDMFKTDYMPVNKCQQK
jgi:hypothetical protein